MEHSCRLDIICFLARSVSCPLVNQSLLAVTILSLCFTFSSFFLNISADKKEAVWGQNLQFLLTVANWHTYALFAQWHLKARWICGTLSPVNPNKTAQCCVSDVLYGLCNNQCFRSILFCSSQSSQC